MVVPRRAVFAYVVRRSSEFGGPLRAMLLWLMILPRSDLRGTGCLTGAVVVEILD